MTKAASYIFIGGPLDLKTQVTDGSYYWRFIEIIPTAINDTTTAAEFDSVFNKAYKEHTYVFTQFDLMGTRRFFYVFAGLKAHEAEQKVGLLIASLIDLYAAS